MGLYHVTITYQGLTSTQELVGNVATRIAAVEKLEAVSKELEGFKWELVIKGSSHDIETVLSRFNKLGHDFVGLSWKDMGF